MELELSSSTFEYKLLFIQRKTVVYRSKTTRLPLVQQNTICVSNYFVRTEQVSAVEKTLLTSVR